MVPGELVPPCHQSASARGCLRVSRRCRFAGEDRCHRHGDATAAPRPGEPADVTVTTCDAQGKAVAAEVSLAVLPADRGETKAGSRWRYSSAARSRRAIPDGLQYPIPLSAGQSSDWHGRTGRILADRAPGISPRSREPPYDEADRASGGRQSFAGEARLESLTQTRAAEPRGRRRHRSDRRRPADPPDEPERPAQPARPPPAARRTGGPNPSRRSRE